MLKVDLLRLRQSRRIGLRGAIPPDADLWAGCDLKFSSAVEVVGSAAMTAEGGFVVRGSWHAPVLRDCDRCLEEVRLPIRRSFSLVYVLDGGEDKGDPDVRVFGQWSTTVDVEEAVREEVVLEVPRYFLPDQEEGCCTHCGLPADRFEHVGSGPGSDVDPRWSALRAIQTD